MTGLPQNRRYLHVVTGQVGVTCGSAKQKAVAVLRGACIRAAWAARAAPLGVRGGVPRVPSATLPLTLTLNQCPGSGMILSMGRRRGKLVALVGRLLTLVGREGGKKNI